jgi:tRNA uridine 5-carboxymethylaminomethyl modification enzyme
LDTRFDIIVVGAGHAGCEAAAAAANMGSSVLLVTMDLNKIAHMSCNPAIGGIAKGQIVREIDAIGGYTGIVTDRSTIQFRMLNRSKGPAMWSPRAQCDRVLFSIYWRETLESLKNLFFWQDSVTEILINEGKVTGVKTLLGNTFFSEVVILTNGTFFGGLMHVGGVKIPGGRASESASYGITDQLKNSGFTVGRMKTGTPPRIDGRTVNFDVLEKQDGDENAGRFSFFERPVPLKFQLPCYITYTNDVVHDILKTGFNDSPLFTGIIEGIGPRYCPSIEDKIVTFAEKPRHQLFLEPEGWKTCEYYVNGFSSSLPQEVQLKALRNVKGLENVKIFRPGYAIEYDYFPPTQLRYTLETKLLKNLYFAGQINGTTGYEEAACQGLIAGINAHLSIIGRAPFILKRDEAYIGVLIDDLVSKGVDEPYRMFTSRSEFRIQLRQDNADERLTKLSYKIGLASKKRYLLYNRSRIAKARVIKFLNSYSISPDDINPLLEKKGTTPIKQKQKLLDVLLRPQISIFDLAGHLSVFNDYVVIPKYLKAQILESVEISMKYRGYLEREKMLATKMQRLEHILIPEGIDYESVHSLSTEGREKLDKIRPGTLGQAARISGVSSADISILMLYLGR